jgi:hypothetical protein
VTNAEVFSLYQGGLLIIAAAAVVAIGVAFWWLKSRADEQRREERLAAIRREANHFFDRLTATGTVPDVAVNIVLQKGEIALLREDASRLLETRAYRVYGGGGTRIRGIYVGGGASESHQRLREIDSGTLILTTDRLIFDGGLENRTLKAKDVVSAEPWSDAVEVSSSRRQKSQVYAVGNPLIWSRMITAVASGEIRTRTEARREPLPEAEARPKAEPPIYDIGR